MFDFFDPTHWNLLTFQQYEQWWLIIVNVLFRGLWAKIIATLCLGLSIYSIVRRKFRPIIALALFFIATIFAYAGALLHWFS